MCLVYAFNWLLLLFSNNFDGLLLWDDNKDYKLVHAYIVIYNYYLRLFYPVMISPSLSPNLSHVTYLLLLPYSLISLLFIFNLTYYNLLLTIGSTFLIKHYLNVTYWCYLTSNVIGFNSLSTMFIIFMFM